MFGPDDAPLACKGFLPHAGTRSPPAAPAATAKPYVAVASRWHDRSMTDDEVLDEARVDGFELIERLSAGLWAVGWARSDDDRWPCFLEERRAISWMRGRLTRGRVFV
jgi:hypothetical protein